MESLEKLLIEMGETYRQQDCPRDFFPQVQARIKSLRNRWNIFKILGMEIMTFFLIAGIFFYSILDLKGMGKFFSVFSSIFFAFTSMTFIVAGVINSQSFFLKLLGHNRIKRINKEGCYFSEEGRLFQWKKV